MNEFSRNEWLTLGVGAVIIIVVVFFGGRLISPSRGNDVEATATPQPIVLPTQQAATTMNPTTTGSAASAQNISNDPNIQIFDETVGTGAVAKAGNTVTVNYLGTLQNGTKFDSSYDRNQPFSFKLGEGQVIKGWDLGVAGMKVGGKRRLVISAGYAYGSQAVGSIPANSTLVFEVELLKVQ